MSRAPDTDFNTDLPADTGTLGTLQRLHFNVPNPATMLVLGERWKDDPAFGYKGASLKTAENLFVDIAHKTLFQGHETVVFQTLATWTQYSSDATFIQSAKNLDLTAASQLVLSSVPDTGHTPPVGADIRPLTGNDFPSVATYTDLRDTLLADLKTEIASLKDKAQALETALAKVGAPYRASDTGTEVDKITDAAGSLRVGHAGDKAGIGIVSKQPVLVATSAEFLASAVMGCHITAGTDSTEADASVFASRDALVRAGRDVTVQSARHAVLHGVASAEVSSHATALLAAREGTAAVLAPTVLLGKKDPSRALGDFDFEVGTQKPTDTVAVESTKLTSVDSGDKVDVKAATKVTIAVGDFSVVIEGSSVTVGTPSAQTLVKITSGKIEINGSPTDNVVVKAGSGVTLTGGGASTVSAKSSGVSISGPQIKLG